MSAGPRPGDVRVLSHQSEIGWWEFVFGTPAAALWPYVREYCGYHERTPAPLRRREMPAPMIVMIIELGPTLRILDAGGGRVLAQNPGGFVAGMDESYTLTETQGEQRGIQVNFTLQGAQRVFRAPMHELTGRVLSLHDVLGGAARSLHPRLEEARGWPARFALLDRFLLERVGAPRPVDDWVAWAYGRIEQSRGRVPVAALAKELGYSRKHVSVSLRERFGLAPKPLARLVRFDHAVQVLRSGRRPDWSELALECGYFDQAHFIREFRSYSGSTPGDFVARSLADGGGLSG